MYLDFEKPLITASIFYYDTTYAKETATQVIEILERHGMFPPDQVCADALTHDDFVPANEHTRQLLIDAYNTEDVLGTYMCWGDRVEDIDFLRINWMFTYYKLKNHPEGNQLPWNVLIINSTYGRLRDSKTYDSWIGCIKDLIRHLQPFRVEIDDVANLVHLGQKIKKKAFIPNEIGIIPWGIYWSPECFKHLGYENMLKVPAAVVEPINDGIFLSLTDCVFDFNSKEAKRTRKSITRYLKKNSRHIGIKGIFGR